LVFVGIAFIITSLSLLLLSRVGEMRHDSYTIPPDSWLRIEQDVGGGIADDGLQVYFLEEKRAALRCALQKEHIKVDE
jgi:hypothetical protein